ncbi:hypothetical protein KUTeg_012669 [Tegillarca granosa]|uniref:Uncharacterized protein n=1 Tax=Tegillarca granosa TaxID=220873 RepID=A0ABQ9F074_TEGGR|nr:hypothetical protein KUTeg_012669 [Tegillarca granosa]
MAIRAPIQRYEENDIWSKRRLLETTSATSGAEPEKSFWDKVKEFYDDKNNFAMYLVLPIIVIVYGGCCLIYCIAKCRRFIKRKKSDKELLENEEMNEDDDVKERNNNITNKHEEPVQSHPRPTITSPTKRTTVAMVTREGAATASDVRIEDHDNSSSSSTPLPWQVPEECENPKQIKHEMATYPTKHVEPEYPTKKGPPPDIRPLPVAKLRAQSRMHQPPSPPPPYEDHGRRNSIDEIIVLGATAQNAKRNRSEEKMRLRSPPAYQSPLPVSTVASRRSDPRAQNALESYTMAKQAAQLLQYESRETNQTGFKKPKRLVFVAE